MTELSTEESFCLWQNCLFLQAVFVLQIKDHLAYIFWRKKENIGPLKTSEGLQTF